jgi:SulP family sulfate permease
MPILVGLKNELKGALSAAVITLPMAIAYGVTAFAALGPDLRPTAALIGLNAAIFGGFCAAWLGGTPTQITGPKAPLTLIMTTMITGLAAGSAAGGGSQFPVETIIGLASMAVLIGGAVQLLFALLGIGNVVKYVPYPVVAGFMNGIAILLIRNQLFPFFGLERGVPLARAFVGFGPMNFAAMGVGISVVAAIFLSRRYLKRFPSFLSGLLVGTVVYLLLSIFPVATSADKIPVIGSLRAVLPQPTALLGILKAGPGLLTATLLLQIAVYGVVLAVIGSMESLMSAVAIDDISASRHDSRKELIGQGVGNMAASLFGALSAAGSIPRSVANYRAGGRRKASGMLCSLSILLLFLAMAPLIGKIPLPVFAAIIIYVGIGLFDRTTLRMLLALRIPGQVRKDIGVSLLINLLVAVITISVNLVAAVIIGLTISAAYFIIKTGTSVIRREYCAERVSSNRTRDLKLSRLIKENGRRIMVFEIQGPIFFGSADRMARRIEITAADATDCILDMKQVSEIDTTGANILIRLHRVLGKEGKRLLISHITAHTAMWDFLVVSGVTQFIPVRHFFEDTDQALEWAENRLLEDLGASTAQQHYTLGQLDLLAGFDPDELEIFQRNLDRVQLGKGELVIKEGRQDRSMYLLTRGSVSVKMHLPASSRTRRLFTFSAGAVFGEIALLDGYPRSANVVADEDSEVFRLSHAKFEDLVRGNPQIAAKLLKNMALVLSHRLRIRSDELRMLEDV